MSQDIKNILDRISMLEGKTVPVSTGHGLNLQQKSVHQRPALFKPKSASPVLNSKKNPEHPMHGELVGDSVIPKQNSLGEAIADIEEDMVSKVKRDLSSYLDQLSNKVSDDGRREGNKGHQANLQNKQKIDRALKNKALGEDPTQQEIGVDTTSVPVQNPQLPEAAVKTYAMEDGTELEAWGDQTRGFELRRGGQTLPTRFRNMNDADIAVSLYQKRSVPKDLDSQDYVEER